MKYIIQFPQSDYWRPKELRGIYVDDIKVVKSKLKNKSGFVFSIVEGEISSEDLLFLKLKKLHPTIKIRIDK